MRFVVEPHPRGWAVVDTRPGPDDDWGIVRHHRAEAEGYRDALNALAGTP